MKAFVGKRKFIIVASGLVVFLVLAFVVGRVVFVGRGPAAGSEQYVQNTLDDATTKAELAEGSCSEATRNKLAHIDQSVSPELAAQAYETQGVCAAFEQEFASSKEAYQKAADLYGQAGMSGDATRLTQSAESVQRIIEAQEAEQTQQDDSMDPDDVVGGT